MTNVVSSRRSRPKREKISLLVERRFPLHLEPSIASIRDLYDRAKAARWNPESSIPWKRFDLAAYDEAQREAARLVWSRRAWIAYGGLPETPALLVRFCLEHQRESDPKMFLTVRGTETAWHTDCAHRFATMLGGYIADPGDPDIAALYNQNFQREAFDAATPLDAYVAAHAILLDGIDLELYREHLRHALDPVAVEILRRIVSDKERHVQFGWMYVEERARGWTDEIRAAVTAQLEDALDLELRGYHAAALGAGPTFERFVAAGEVTRESGLGASSASEEQNVVRTYVADTRRRLAGIGVALPTLQHRQLGPV